MISKGKIYSVIKQLRWFYLFAALIVVIIIPLWIIYLAPALTKIPSNFSYKADLLSIDNFYDGKAKKFQGEHISKTIFSYKVVGTNAKYLTIENEFTVKTLYNKTIIAVKRLYYINPYTGKHVLVANKPKRFGYLFGPRFATTKKSFYYWHVNYNSPALLKFINKEKLFGLTVYHYQATYQADQSADLKNLPEVPEKKGIKANVTLQVWIEPISGWLVKYQDNTLAYYYDRNTGKITQIWNKFSNRYTQTSINQQVQHARFLKSKILFVDFSMPIFLVVLALFLVFLAFAKENPSHIVVRPIGNGLMKIKKYPLFYILFVVLICVMVDVIYYFYVYKKSQQVFLIGISPWNSTPESKEIIEGFKKELANNGYHEGQNIKFIEKNPEGSIEKQIDIIQYFLEEHVNIIFTITTPGTLVAKGITNDTPIVFSDVTYPVLANLIHSLDSSKNNLVGVRNYISPAMQFYVFEKLYPTVKAIGFVHHKGNPDSEIQAREFKIMLEQRGISVFDISAIDLADLRLQLQKSNNYNALYLACDTLLQGEGGKMVIDFGHKNKIPVFSCEKSGVEDGALVGYVTEPYLVGKLAGTKAALILNGAAPDWLHTVAPKEGYLIINAKTAQYLGINISPELKNEADAIIDR